MYQIYPDKNSHKTYTHKQQTQNIRISSSGTAPVYTTKKCVSLGHSYIVDHSIDLSIPGLRKVWFFLKKKKKKEKKEWTEAC